MVAPGLMRDWVERVLRPHVVLELGAHVGEDTRWLAAIPGTTVHAFEADPRNKPASAMPPNVMWNPVAVSDHNGHTQLVPSVAGRGGCWTESSSICRPTGHLSKHPDVTFGEPIEVRCLTLDSYRTANRLDHIDLVYADLQGAEALMIAGGRETFANTGLLFTECSDEELYEGQPALAEILRLLGQDWSLLERIDDDNVLLRHRSCDVRAPSDPRPDAVHAQHGAVGHDRERRYRRRGIIR